MSLSVPENSGWFLSNVEKEVVPVAQEIKVFLEVLTLIPEVKKLGIVSETDFANRFLLKYVWDSK